MAFLELAQKRYSVRAYKKTPVPEDALMKVLEAGRLAPSACNNQPWYFIVIKDSAKKRNWNAVYGRDWFLQAPVIIAVCIDKNAAWVRKDGKCYGDVDAAIAMDHMILQAAELGLGTCWIGAFEPGEAGKTLGLPDHIEPVLLTPLGYPDCVQPHKNRKKISDIVFWETFNGKKQSSV